MTDIEEIEDLDLQVIIVGSFHGGFTLAGPVTMEDVVDGTKGEACEVYHDDWSWGSGWWNLTLRVPTDGYDPAGNVVVFAGSVVEPWLIYGPFKDLAAAHSWATANGLGAKCIIELKPLPPAEAAAA